MRTESELKFWIVFGLAALVLLAGSRVLERAVPPMVVAVSDRAKPARTDRVKTGHLRYWASRQLQPPSDSPVARSPHLWQLRWWPAAASH